MHEKPRTLSASTLIGDEVKNAAGEQLGDLEEIMIDLNTGRVAYAVLSFGGFLGMGDKLFAIPWEALSVNAEDHSLTLNVAKEKLENAPGFDEDDWPDTTAKDDGWLVEVYDYYSYRPYWR